ncbi:MAG: hypothetical protein H8F28_10195 [Fibrella sp.]|nr:hypothetical protein [Armatimonadota bacterium]
MTSSDQLWQGLQRVRTVEFVTHGTSATGWSGGGSGVVTVESPSSTVLVFRESGIWRPTGGRDLRFHNVYRWTCFDKSVRLEHLRFGDEHPVFLFDLAPDPDGIWSSLTPHLCRQDTYTARLRQEEAVLFLAWTITGPEKREEIAYKYSLA